MESRLEARERPKFSRGLAPKRRSRRGFSAGGVRGKKTADFLGDLGGAGGQAAKEFKRAGYVGPQLGLFYEIASGGAVKGQNFLGARAEAALALVVSLGGGHAAKG